MKRTLIGFAILLAAGSLEVTNFAQMTTSTITGTVTDTSGAVIPGAAVTVNDPAIGFIRNTATNGAGSYLIPGLPPGTYTLAISAKGFKTYSATGIIVRAAEAIRANAMLQVGAVSTQVTVSGTGIGQVQTQNGQLSSTIVGKQVTQLVLNGRSYTQLLSLVPGVISMTGVEPGATGPSASPSYSVNGGRTEYNNWMVDGVGDMDMGSGGSTNNVFPSPDAIGEERVLSSNYSAQYGGDASGTMIASIKQGTNQFHGDAYEFNRNSAFSARNFFEIPNRGFENWNDYGYTFGGPFYIPHFYNTNRTKTFFFWSQEWQREIVPNDFDIQVPSIAERNGDFSDVCPGAECPVNPVTKTAFPGNQVSIDPNAQLMLPLISEPNFGSGAQSSFISSPSYPTHWFENLIRVDQNITPKIRMMVHYIHDSWTEVTPTPLWSTGNFPAINTVFSVPATHFVAQLTTTASPSLMNEFIFGYTNDPNIPVNVGYWELPAGLTMKPLFNNGFGGKIPGIGSICCNAEDNGGAGFGEDPGFMNPASPRYNANPIYTFRDIVSKIVGNHNLTFGGDFIAYQKNEQNGSTPNTNGELTFSNSSAVTTGNAFADFLTGRIAQYQQLNTELKYYNRYKTFSPYIQDDWHIRKRLTLNLGFRADLFGLFHVKSGEYTEGSFDPAVYNPANAPEIDVTGAITGQAGALVPGVGNEFDGLIVCGVNGVPASCMNGHLFNPAPRFGFAWDPTGHGTTAIRGGYGIYYDHMNGNEANTESLEGTPPFSLSPSVFNIVGYQNVGGTELEFPTSATALEPQMFWPMVQQWNLDVEHNLGHNTVASIAYVGSKGTHLTDNIDENQLHPLPLSQDPFGPDQPITSANCGPPLVGPNGLAVTGQAATLLGIACGNDADPYRPFLGYGNITLLQSEANSNYNALEFYVRKQAGPLSFSFAYTYSHALDDGSDRYDAEYVNSYNLESFYGNSDYNETDNISASYVYDLPFFQHSRSLLREALGAWELSGIMAYHTGNPFTVSNGVFGDTSGVGNGTGKGSYPDICGNIHAAPSETNVPGIFGPLLYNPGAFCAPRGLTFGNAGRNILYNPAFTEFDSGFFKNIYIGHSEERYIQLRAEAFNISNTANLDVTGLGVAEGTVGTGCYAGTDNSAGSASCIASQTFLHATGAHNPRIFQFAFKFIF